MSEQKMKFKGFAQSLIGGREVNQDAFLVNDDCSVYAVADGVGGGLDGDVASSMAIDNVKNSVKQATDLKPSFASGQKLVLDESYNRHGMAIMGTTLTAIHLSAQGEMSLCHVGDSRCYILGEGCLRQLTEDQEFYDENVQAPVLASYLGVPADIHPLEIIERQEKVNPQNRILLCSDGLYKQVTEPRIVELMGEMATTPQELVDKLCDEASQAQYSDNITVIYIEVQADE